MNTLATLSLDPLTLPLQGLQVIEASAGTGKTWTLAALYLRLVLGHGGGAMAHEAGLYPPQILVMTFTEAATAELRSRVRERLSQAARYFGCDALDTDDADDFLRQLRQAYPTDQWPGCARRLDLAAQWMDDAAIFTIHGWSSRMLRQHAFDSSSLFQQSHVEDGERLQRAAVQDYWRRWFYPLSARQLQALQTLRPRLNTPDDLLQQLREYWRQTDRAPHAPGQEGPTPDALLQQWEHWHHQKQALEAQARAAWTPDVVARVQDAAARKCLKNYRQDWLAGWLAQMAGWAQGGGIESKTLDRFSAATLTDKGWTDASQFAAFCHIEDLQTHEAQQPMLKQPLLAHAAQAVGEAYRHAKAELAQFDFSDLLQCLYHALQAPDGRLAQAIAHQYPVALVDEFQDTDPWQWGALSRIYGQTPRPDTGLIMIGDPKQAIYSFRGADLDTYLLARRQAAAVHTLSGNFRSTAQVVAAVNHVFAHADQPFGAVPFERVHACNSKVQALQVGGHTQPALTVWHLDRDKPAVKSVYLREMAALFASQMVALLNQGAAAPGDMAVLVRDWGQAAAIREALGRRGVRSVYLSERDSVFATTEATDLWRILRAVAHPRTSAWVRAALGTRLWGLEWAQLEALFQDEVAWDAQVERFHEWQRIWQRQGLLPMLHHLIHDQAIALRLLSREQGAGHEGERRLTNLLHLGELLQAASHHLQGEAALVRHLAQQLRDPAGSGDAAQLRLESDAELVQVITVHKSKGLQYPLVFLPFVSSFKAESKDSGRDDALRLAEDIRLLYVALTRAERALWIGLAPFKGDLDPKQPRAASALSRLLRRARAEDLQECLAHWRTCPDIAVRPAPPPDTACYTPPVSPGAGWRPVLQPLRHHRRRWWVASFSALTQRQTPATAQGTTPGFDQDVRLADAQWDAAGALVPQASGGSAYDLLPAGSAFGTLLHDLLEWQARRGWPAAQDAPGPAQTQAWATQLARGGQRLGLDEAQTTQLSTWVAQIVRCALPLSPPLQLGSLDGTRAWPEMAFSLTVKALDATPLDGLVRQHVLPGEPRPALPPHRLEGMLVGYMDLVLEHGGRYHVLDYKSNRLDAYDPAALQQAALAHRYDLQACLYLLALHRLLRSRLQGYDYDRHVGGALVLFLRGIEQPGSGLLALRPPRALIEALDKAFAEPCTQGDAS